MNTDQLLELAEAVRSAKSDAAFWSRQCGKMTDNYASLCRERNALAEQLKGLKTSNGSQDAPADVKTMKVGDRVLYLGGEWTVVERYYRDVLSNHTKLSRINVNDCVESVRLPYHCDDLVSPTT